MGRARSRALIDTNVLVYALDPNAPHHEACRRLRDEGLPGVELVLTPQVLYEFIASVTSAKFFATPLDSREASEAALALSHGFKVTRALGSF